MCSSGDDPKGATTGRSNSQLEPQVVKSALLAAVSGIVTKTSVAPLERIKVRPSCGVNLWQRCGLAVTECTFAVVVGVAVESCR
jgi:hypothetical protein